MTRPVDKSKDNEAKSFGLVTFAREHVAKDLVKQVSQIRGFKNLFEYKEKGGGRMRSFLELA